MRGLIADSLRGIVMALTLALSEMGSHPMVGSRALMSSDLTRRSLLSLCGEETRRVREGAG